MRVQLELPEERVQELKTLMDKLGIDTYKELFNNSLTLLDWCVEEAEAGRTLASIDEEEDRYRELAMPVLDRVAKRSASRVKPVSNAQERNRTAG